MADLIDVNSGALTDIKTSIAGGIKANQMIAMHNAITVSARQAGKTIYHQLQGRVLRHNVNHRVYTLDELNYNFKYMVDNIFPYEVKSANDNNDISNGALSYGLWFGPKTFVTRFEAEQYRLEKLVDYYTVKSKEYSKETSKHNRHKYGFKGYISVDGNKSKILACTFKNQLKTLEEDHPEWLI